MVQGISDFLGDWGFPDLHRKLLYGHVRSVKEGGYRYFKQIFEVSGHPVIKSQGYQLQKVQSLGRLAVLFKELREPCCIVLLKITLQAQQK